MKSLTLSTVILVLLAVLSCTEDAQTGIPERNDSVLSNQKGSGNSSVQGEYFIDLKEAEAISSRFMNMRRRDVCLLLSHKLSTTTKDWMEKISLGITLKEWRSTKSKRGCYAHKIISCSCHPAAVRSSGM